MTAACYCLCPKPDEWVRGRAVGAGSFGTVHLAMNKATGALFVVKSTESGAGLDALKNEADILESLNSQYIIECKGRNLSRGSNGEQKLSIFMEYMAGGSLSDVAEKFGGALDEEVIRLYTREILKGVKYLHENGIIHCDLKCKNVLLGSTGNVKLADFGCAKRLSDLKKDSNSECSWKSIGGTPLWMAPEVIKNEGLDFAADIWSLGCTVIEMATGRPPWSGEISDNPMAAVLKIACNNETPKFPAHFSKEGMDFLAKCLERDPKKRGKAGELLNHPFISRNFLRSSRKECLCSPASVLDLRSFEEDFDSDEYSETSCEDDESKYRNPFSTRGHISKNRKTRRPSAPFEITLDSSDDWITVR